MRDKFLVKKWSENGLSSDEFFLENAIISNKTYRWPFLIDPESQAIKWISSSETKNLVKLVNNSDREYLISKLKFAIESGYTTVIQDVDETYDYVLDPLMARKVNHYHLI